MIAPDCLLTVFKFILLRWKWEFLPYNEIWLKNNDKKECDLDCTNIEMYDIIKIFMYGVIIKEDYSMEI